LLGILGVWRLSRLLYAEDGPWNLLVRLRKAVGTGFWASLLDCFYCLSLWIGIPFACLLGETWKERGLLWPALCAGAILLERVTERAAAKSAVLYYEDQEDEHVLRQEQNATESRDAELGSRAQGSDESSRQLVRSK